MQNERIEEINSLLKERFPFARLVSFDASGFVCSGPPEQSRKVSEYISELLIEDSHAE